MTNDEILEMAKQAGIDMSDRKKYTDYSVACANILLLAFARLIEVATRDEIAKMFDGEVWAYDYRDIAAAIRNSGGAA